MIIQEETYHGMSYIPTVTILPYVPIVNNATLYEVSLSYNVDYNVTAFASMCGEMSQVAIIRQLYGEF